MSPTFAVLAEQVQARSAPEREELKFLLERSLISGRRDEIRSNFRRSRAELRRGKLKFSGSVNELRQLLRRPTVMNRAAPPGTNG